jgi:hypothetical protein
MSGSEFSGQRGKSHNDSNAVLLIASYSAGEVVSDFGDREK